MRVRERAVSDAPLKRLVAIVAGAFALRLSALLAVGVQPPMGDEVCYRFACKWGQLAIKWPFCLECRPPGYPLFLRLLTWLGVELGPLTHEQALWGSLFVQTLVSALTLVPLWVFGRRWVGERATLVACALVALYPPLVLHAILFMSETLYVFLFLAAVALVARPEAGRAGHFAGGLALAAAILVRSAGKAFIPLTVLWLLVTPWWERRERMVRAGLLLAGLALPFGFWTVRNALVYGELITADCQTMFNLWQGNPPPGMKFMAVAKVYYAHSDSPTEREAYARERALERITAAPFSWAVRKVREQLPRGFGLRHDSMGYFVTGRLGEVPPWFKETVRRIETWMWVLIAVPGLLGLALVGSDPRRTLIVLLGLASIATHVIAFAVPRHRLPLVPFLALGAGWLCFRDRPQSSSIASPTATRPGRTTDA